jgi:hypothetical protein
LRFAARPVEPFRLRKNSGISRVLRCTLQGEAGVHHRLASETEFPFQNLEAISAMKATSIFIITALGVAIATAAEPQRVVPSRVKPTAPNEAASAREKAKRSVSDAVAREKAKKSVAEAVARAKAKASAAAESPLSEQLKMIPRAPEKPIEMPAAGIYEAAPFSMIVVVPGPARSPMVVKAPENADYSLKTVEPKLELVPR